MGSSGPAHSPATSRTPNATNRFHPKAKTPRKPYITGLLDGYGSICGYRSVST